MTNKPSIIIVEHDPMLGIVFHEVLTLEGYAAELWTEAAGAVEHIRQIQPDLVILDLWLQRRGDGWQIFDDLQHDPFTQAIPVILCSTDTLTLQWNGLRAGQPAAILEKPFDLEVLLAIVADLLSAQAPDHAGVGTTRLAHAGSGEVSYAIEAHRHREELSRGVTALSSVGEEQEP
jgi:DNA-binding response OmpR family regulator